ncbi:uncharacterized protein [Ptychodera flava]|uniref:uncharacterized protein n=1 Tax=Ptychodera flava TaxID=63121 RepID=UPI00396A9E0A
MMLESYKGNRFNIMYYNAAAVYYHASDILQFITNWPNPNRLLSAVSEDLQIPVYKAEIRALGLIDKVVTGPYWRIVEKVDNILDMNQHLLQMKLGLERWTHDATTVLEGEPMFAPEVAPIHKDALYDKLMEETGSVEFDSLTVQALEMLMHSLLIILERQCEEQLPGGKYCDLSDGEKESVSSVPTTNVAGERDFAILDLLVRTKPAATTLCYGTLVMWANNKTKA